MFTDQPQPLPNPNRPLDLKRTITVTERGREMAASVKGWKLSDVKASNGIGLADGVTTTSNTKSPALYREYVGGDPQAITALEKTLKLNQYGSYVQLREGYSSGSYYYVLGDDGMIRSDKFKDNTAFVFAIPTQDGLVVEISPQLSTKVEGDARTGDGVFTSIKMSFVVDASYLGDIKNDPRLVLEMAQAKFTDLFASKFENDAQVCYIPYPPTKDAKNAFSGAVMKKL